MSSRTKPAFKKPYKDFPLTPHPTGRWCKKIKGRLYYFGRIGAADEYEANWKAALDKYHADVHRIQAGLSQQTETTALTVRRLVNTFLADKENKVKITKELSPRTFASYYATCERVIEVLGRDVLVETLESTDFQRLRKELAKGRGLVSLGNEVRNARVLFNYAFKEELIDRPVRMGSSFRGPPAKELRRKRREKGKRMFQPDELRNLLKAAKNPLKCMILLAANCGFGQGDLSAIPISAFDLENGWVDFPRPKTEVDRRCKLWPETVKEVRAVLDARPLPTDPADEGCLLLTKYGNRFVRSKNNGTDTKPRMVQIDSIGMEFNKLLTALKFKRPGLSFYALRHGFETAAGGAKDQVAVDNIMGHAPPADDMGHRYREEIADERLQAVTDHVRAWLWPDDGR